jgi:hypothetical protein
MKGVFNLPRMNKGGTLPALEEIEDNRDQRQASYLIDKLVPFYGIDSAGIPPDRIEYDVWIEKIRGDANFASSLNIAPVRGLVSYERTREYPGQLVSASREKIRISAAGAYVGRHSLRFFDLYFEPRKSPPR